MAKIQVSVNVVLEEKTFKNSEGKEITYVKTGLILEGDDGSPIYNEFKFVDSLGKYLARQLLKKGDNK